MAGYKWSIVFLFLCVEGYAQVNRYVVFFKDKTNTPYSIGQPRQFLSARSLARRAKQNIAITSDDLPVDPAYIAMVKNAGAKTFFSSRWMNCVLIEIDSNNLTSLQALGIVSKIVFAAPGHKLLGGRVKKMGTSNSTAQPPINIAQLQQLGLDEMQKEGYHGENISVAILDAGFPGVDNTNEPFQHLFQNAQIKSTFDFVGNTGNVFQYSSHGTEVLSIMAANDGEFTGAVYQANFFLFVTEDVSSEYRIEEYNWLFAAERADSSGVDVINTSLGYSQFDDSSMDYTPSNMDGKTTVITQAATQAISKGMVVVCAAGNEGGGPWNIITAPADAVGILACGAVDITGQLIPFSSVGPSADNRIKPDVVALGFGTQFVNPQGAVGAGNGTSFASPLVASLATGVWQAYPSLTAKQVYQVITQSADQAAAPDNLKGYGVPHFTEIKSYLESPDLITIYPNPSTTSNSNLIKINFKYAVDVTTISFLDIYGRVLSQNSTVVDVENNPVVYDISTLAAGVYLVKIENELVTRIIRFVKL